MILAIDFDGTCVMHEFPNVGDDVPHAVNTLRNFYKQGHELVLYTMRSHQYLSDAIRWFAANGINLSGIQYSKGQTDWTCSNKCYAQVYIDDAALGCPLIYGEHTRPYVDWIEVGKLMKQKMSVDANPNPVVKQ